MALSDTNKGILTILGLAALGIEAGVGYVLFTHTGFTALSHKALSLSIPTLSVISAATILCFCLASYRLSKIEKTTDDLHQSSYDEESECNDAALDIMLTRTAPEQINNIYAPVEQKNNMQYYHIATDSIFCVSIVATSAIAYCINNSLLIEQTIAITASFALIFSIPCGLAKFILHKMEKQHTDNEPTYGDL